MKYEDQSISLPLSLLSISGPNVIYNGVYNFDKYTRLLDAS